VTNALQSHSNRTLGLAIETLVKPGTPRSQGFPRFEEQQHRLGEEQTQIPVAGHLETGQRASDKQYGSVSPLNTYDDNNSLTYTGNKGSRFAKFFDSKTKENMPSGLKPQTPTNFLSPSSNPPLRQEQTLYSGGPPLVQERTVDDLFAMLNSSSQVSFDRRISTTGVHWLLRLNGRVYPIIQPPISI